MKTFRNKKVGTLEHVTNEKLIKQYEKYTDLYELVDDEKVDKDTTKDKKSNKKK